MPENFDATFDRAPDGTPIFVIGLTMAGAISAGAYTAGVVDYLLRAMKAHNDRVGTPGGPRHKVMVKAISGASAGGMCAGLIATNLLAVGSEDEPDWDTPARLAYPGGKGSLVLRRIYRAWVEDVTMWNPRTQTGLLALDDIEGQRATLDQASVGIGPKGAISLLNGLHLDDVAAAAVGGIPAWPADRPGYDFLSAQLDLFLTTTGLNSTVYQVTFSGGAPFLMDQHGLIRHFRVDDLGTGPALPSPWLADWRDEGIPLAPRSETGILPLAEPDGGNWVKLTVASLATGAFPVALAPRVVDATPIELGALSADGMARGGALPVDIPGRLATRPAFGDVATTARTPYVAIDGGATDNEPFSHTRYAIRQATTTAEGDVELLSNPRGAKTAHRAVLMVDPFPEGSEFTEFSTEELTQMLNLVSVAGKIPSTLMGQARFKPDELMQAQDPEIHSRFLISPRRADPSSPDGVAVGAAAIACGILGGFGGFLDEDFRRHDFILGQRNCQKFLRDHFVLDPANPVLALDAEAQAGPDGVPIIDPGAANPLLAEEIPLHDWPALNGVALALMLKQLGVRLERMFTGKSIKFEGTSWILGSLLKWLTRTFGPKAMKSLGVSMASEAMLSALITRDQHASFRGLSPVERLLLTKLISFGETSTSAEALQVTLEEDRAAGNLPDGITLPTTREVEVFLLGQARAGTVKRDWKSYIGTARFCFDMETAGAISE